MADSPPPSDSSDWPTTSTELPLASLSPTATSSSSGGGGSSSSSSSSAYISAVVTLIWPFSSSSRTLSIVASEQDPLLRQSKGQLRVNFQGPAATGVDAHGLQSGDHVCILLDGARWEELAGAGPRDVPWAVSFEKKLAMKIKSGDRWNNIDIDVDADPEPELPPALVEEASYSPSTAHPATPPPARPARFNESEWVTPGLFKRRLASSDSEPSNAFAIGEQGLFDEVDEYDLGRRKKRARFSNSYRFEEDGDAAAVDSDGTLEEALMNGMSGEDMAIERSGNSTHVDMPPPPPRPQSALDTNFDVGDTPDSPELKPVPNEQLPIISSSLLEMGLTGAETTPTHVKFAFQAFNTNFDVEDSWGSLGSPDMKPVPNEQLPTISVSPAPGAEEVSQGSTGSSTIRNDSVDDLQAAPDVAIVTVNEKDDSTSVPQNPTKPGTKPPTTPGPSDAQKLADQRRGSFSEDDRFPSDYESEKDSLFDEFSDNELRRRTTKSRTLGRSPLKSVESLKPRRATPLRSKLTLETNVASPEVTTKDEGDHPKTPFLYLPTPSPKTEKRGAQFPPTSAPPKFMSREYENVLGGDIASPIRRRSSFWGMREEPVSSSIDDYFGRPKKNAEVPKEVESASGTEEGFSGFSTPMEGDDDDDDDQDEEEDDDDDDDESFGIGLGFRSGVTTNLSDFPALRSLTWGAVVDLIAVVTRSWPIGRAKRGQKDYFMSMRIVDSSFPAGMTATVLRPHKEALPAVQAGDVVLLRSFKITTYKHDFVATSTPNSAWAVWREHGKGRPAITGPPVEYGEGEEEYVAAIAEWYERLDPDIREGMGRGNGGNGGNGGEDIDAELDL